MTNKIFFSIFLITGLLSAVCSTIGYFAGAGVFGILMCIFAFLTILHL